MNENFETLIQKRNYVNSSYDFELDIQRKNKVEYLYSYPKSGKLNGIVFIIPGFGEDTNSEYSQKLRDYIAQTFRVVAVHVIYHCFHSRVNNGATVSLDKTDENILLKNLRDSGVTNIENNSLNEILNQLMEAVEIKKNRGEIDPEIRLLQTLTLNPKNNEYQNFGVLQALDHINVLRDIKKKGLNFIEGYPTILMGSSHGGYIAYLIAKFAPKSIDCVIDNSAYVTPPLRYIIAKDIDIKEPEFRYTTKNLVLHYFVKTHWNNDANSYYYFSQDRYDIRDLSNLLHTKAMAKKSKSHIKYISYHSSNDEIALPKEKVEFYKTLNKLGFDIKLHIISKEAEVDGKFIKSLKHGLDMSIKELAKRELPKALKLRNPAVADEVAPISYECNTIKYDFEIINDVFSATQSPLKSIQASIIERYQKNIQYFQEKQPKLYVKLASFDSAVEQGLYTNKYDLMFNNNSFDVQELTTNNRLYGQDSNKFAYEIAQNFSEKVEKFAFFGVGLGAHLTAIDKKISSGSYLIVEDDLELFKLSTLVTPYYELARNSNLYFSIFESEDEFKDEVVVFLNSTNVDVNISYYSMSNRSDTKKIYFNKIFGKENE